MATIQEIKKKKKASATGKTQKLKTRKETIVASAKQETKTIEEVVPISKYKEWKLLYAPYPFSTNSNNPSPITSSQSRSNVEERESSITKDLCKNCKKNETCQLPKPEGGIWHCEDYE